MCLPHCRSAGGGPAWSAFSSARRAPCARRSSGRVRAATAAGVSLLARAHGLCWRPRSPTPSSRPRGGCGTPSGGACGPREYVAREPPARAARVVRRDAERETRRSPLCRDRHRDLGKFHPEAGMVGGEELTRSNRSSGRDSITPARVGARRRAWPIGLRAIGADRSRHGPFEMTVLILRCEWCGS